jgi:hypothetical protein
MIKGNDVIFIGVGALHEPKFHDHVVTSSYEDGLPSMSPYCPSSIETNQMKDYFDQFQNEQPMYMTMTAFVFINQSLQSTVIVSSLFPE